MDLKSRLNFILRRTGYCALVAMFASTLSGCLAASLAPLALQALGIGIKAGTMLAHGKDKSPNEQELEDETTLADSDFDRNKAKNASAEGKCNELVLITPAIIEFRTDTAGLTVWRELGLGGSADAPKWTVIGSTQTAAATETKIANVTDVPTAKDFASGGWLPANNIEHMNFTPPLKNSTPGDDSFLAYAPAKSFSTSERDQLASLVLDFGPVAGTFQYKGREYKYATLKELPCFPVPQ